MTNLCDFDGRPLVGDLSDPLLERLRAVHGQPRCDHHDGRRETAETQESAPGSLRTLLLCKNASARRRWLNSLDLALDRLVGARCPTRNW